MSSEEDVNLARIAIVDVGGTRYLFNGLREYYRGKNLDFLLNVLEASILNAITDREVFIKLFIEVLKRNEIKEEIMTAMRDDMHKTVKEFNHFKEKGVNEIIKKYLGSSKNNG
jgi:hypothetical protein